MQRVIAALVVLVASTSLVLANAPHTISYQGRLTDTGKNPVPDGSYSVTFSLYNVPTGGSALWNETKSVTTSKGLFTTLLGSVTPLSPSVFSDSTRYLGIKIGANTEATPRSRFSSSAFAFQAVKADTAAYALAAPGTGAASGWTDFGSEVFLTTNSDRVGIGTTSPTAKLQISGQGTDGKSLNANNVLTVSPGNYFVGVNADTSTYPAEVFRVHSPRSGSLGGMTVSTPGFGDYPFYGYSPGGQLLAYHDYDGDSKQWRLWNNGNLGPVVDSLGRVRINTGYLASQHDFYPVGLKVGGTSTSGAAYFASPSNYDAVSVYANKTGISVEVPDVYAGNAGPGERVGIKATSGGSGTGNAIGISGGANRVGTASDTSVGIHGWGASSGINIGVRGEASGNICYGVYGKADNMLSAKNCGGYFVSDETGVSIEVGKEGVPTARGARQGLTATTYGAGTVLTQGLYAEAHEGYEADGLRAVASKASYCYGIDARAYDAGSTGYAVVGISNGAATADYGVYAKATGTHTNFGVWAKVENSQNETAVYGNADPYYPWSFAGWFDGKVNIAGTLSKSAGSFRIDHPLDPENKYLQHSFVESPDMMNIYNGNVTLDATGNATVALPDYFEALNQDFRYQLTPIGAPGPNLYISQEVTGNQFKIAGGTPGMKVSWQVTGIRHDPYANANRIQVEVNKDPDTHGLYLHPEVYGAAREMGISYKRFQAEAEKADAAREQSSPTGH